MACESGALNEDLDSKLDFKLEITERMAIHEAVMAN